MNTEKFNTEILFTPDWRPDDTGLMGDFIGEVGYVTDVGTIRILGRKDVEVSMYQTQSKTNGATTSITATKNNKCL